MVKSTPYFLSIPLKQVTGFAYLPCGEGGEGKVTMINALMKLKSLTSDGYSDRVSTNFFASDSFF